MKRAFIALLCTFFYSFTIAQQSSWPSLGSDSIRNRELINKGLEETINTSGTLANMQVHEGSYASNLPVISVENAVITGGGNESCYMVLLLSLSKRSKDPVKVQYHTMSNASTPGEDYLQKKGTIIFPANRLLQTIRVQVDCDVHNKGYETFAIKLSEAVNATPENVSVIGTIQNSSHLSTVSLNSRLTAESQKEAAIIVSTNK
jgi:hypothetical protein